MTIHKQITRLQDEQERARHGEAQARKYAIWFKERREQKETDEKLKELIDKGMGPMEALFNLEYNKGASND